MRDTPDGFKETKIGPIPMEWEIVRLEDVAVVSRGISWRKAEESETGVPVISIPNVREGRVSFDVRYKVAKRITPAKQLKVGDVLLVGSSGSAHNVGRAAVLQENPFPILAFASFLSRVSPRNDDVDRSFLFFLLTSPWVDFLACSKQAADGKYNLQVTQLRDHPIPLPPLHEQRRIAHVLNIIQQAIAAQDDLITVARELKRSLMQRLFTYGPNAKLAPTKETEIGIVPEHWDVVPLGKILQAAQYGLSVRADLTSRYPMLRMNNLVDGRIDVSDLKYVSLGEDDFTKFKLHRRDVLFNRTNSYELVGKTAIFNIDGDFTFASYLIRVIPDASQLLPEYLNYCLNWNDAQRRLKMLATRGVSQSNISATKLKRFVVGLPPLAEQDNITRILINADRKIAAEEERKAALQALFKSTLHQLVTGQIRLKDAEL